MSLRDKMRGCLIGGAIGDALGWPVEFSSEQHIFSKYGADGIRAFDLNARGVAEITDDTQMTLFTANGLLCAAAHGRETCPRGYVAQAYRDWLSTQRSVKPAGVSWLLDVPEPHARRAPGNACLTYLSAQSDETNPCADYLRCRVSDSKGCGGIMRVAPMGLVRCDDIRMIDYEAAQLAAITHGHSLGFMPAAALAHIVNRLVYPAGDMDLRGIVIEARDTVSALFEGDGHLPALRKLIDLAVALAEGGSGSDLENIHRLGEGWVGEEALAIALYCALKYRDDFSAAVIAAVNHKGDSDSTGAITGNILGAMTGYEAIDDAWKEKLELRDVILEIADDMNELADGKVAARYKKSPA